MNDLRNLIIPVLRDSLRLLPIPSSPVGDFGRRRENLRTFYFAEKVNFFGEERTAYCGIKNGGKVDGPRGWRADECF